jgi:hypothetical protein
VTKNLRRIEVTFPVPVELPDDFQQRLIELVTTVCKAYEAANPGRSMWTFGVGSKITYMPMMREEEEAGRGMEFDDDTLSIECAERERYHRWFVPKGISYECCRACGMVRRADGENDDTPCRGKVSVGPRTDKSEGGA